MWRIPDEILQQSGPTTLRNVHSVSGEVYVANLSLF